MRSVIASATVLVIALGAGAAAGAGAIPGAPQIPGGQPQVPGVPDLGQPDEKAKFRLVVEGS